MAGRSGNLILPGDDLFDFDYVPEKTAREFHMARDEYDYRFIRGVPASGKSVAAIVDMYLWAMDQTPYRGVRYTRFAAVRSTYPAIKSTLLKTWKEWFPERFWPVKKDIPYETLVVMDLPDGTVMHMEVIFIAVETADDVDKLKSLELTGGFVNEAFECDKLVITTLFERTGRYPRMNKRLGRPGPKRRGVWCDTNSPHEKHWWAEWERNPPESMKFYVQPAPLIRIRDSETQETIGWKDNPEAENVGNLADGHDYYRALIPGLTPDQIKVTIENQFAAVFPGKAVYAKEWRDGMVIDERELTPYPNVPLLIGIDTSGFNPAAVLAQEYGGRLIIYKELVAFDTLIDTFFDDVLVSTLLSPRFKDLDVFAIVDPSDPKDVRTGMTPMQLLKGRQIQTEKAPSNNPTLRINAVKYFMRLHDGLIIDNFSVQDPLNPEDSNRNSAVLVDGFKGGYNFPKISGSNAGYQSRPSKNDFSHVHDAVQYLALWCRRAHIKSGEQMGTDGSVDQGVAARYRNQRVKRPSFGYA